REAKQGCLRQRAGDLDGPLRLRVLRALRVSILSLASASASVLPSASTRVGAASSGHPAVYPWPVSQSGAVRRSRTDHRLRGGPSMGGTTPELRELFEDALAQPPAARAAWLDRHCTDPARRATILRMLDA